MGNTVLTSDDIGTIVNNQSLKAGDDQSMVFIDNNLPPFFARSTNTQL